MRVQAIRHFARRAKVVTLQRQDGIGHQTFGLGFVNEVRDEHVCAFHGMENVGGLWRQSRLADTFVGEVAIHRMPTTDGDRQRERFAVPLRAPQDVKAQIENLGVIGAKSAAAPGDGSHDFGSPKSDE